MKKKMSLMITLLVLSILPFVSAEINLNPLAKATYNKGDIININGYVNTDKTGTYDLSMFLVCDTSQLQFSSRRITVQSNQIKKDMSISGEAAVPFSMSGDCRLSSRRYFLSASRSSPSLVSSG